MGSGRKGSLLLGLVLLGILEVATSSAVPNPKKSKRNSEKLELGPQGRYENHQSSSDSEKWDSPESPEESFREKQGDYHYYDEYSTSRDGHHDPYESPKDNYGPPKDNYGPPKDTYGSTDYYKPSNQYPGYYLIKTLTYFIPLGLLLAAIPPNTLTINVSSTGRRKRSTDSEAKGEAVEVEDEEELPLPSLAMPYEDGSVSTWPVLELIDHFGFAALFEKSCQKRIFCEMARIGNLPQANTIQWAAYKAVTLVPSGLASLYVGDLFEKVSGGYCETYSCTPRHF